MADGCVGIQFLIDTGKLEIVFLFNRETGAIREGMAFPACKSVKGLRQPKEAKYKLFPNFCPSCGMPFIAEGEHRGEPTCTGRLAAAEQEATGID